MSEAATTPTSSTGGMGSLVGTAVAGPVGGIVGGLFDATGGFGSMGGSGTKTSKSRAYSYANSSFAPVTYMAGGIGSMGLIIIGIAVLFVFKLFGKKKR